MYITRNVQVNLMHIIPFSMIYNIVFEVVFI